LALADAMVGLREDMARARAFKLRGNFYLREIKK
jgi:hypothetical protein